jgi:hypothetical protein
MHAIHALAALAQETKSTHSILLWSGILIVLMLVLFGAVSLLKKWMRPDDLPDRGVGFTLSDLRELHRQGKISDQEFELTRNNMVAAAKRMTEKMPDITPRRNTPDSTTQTDSLPPAQH